MIGPRTSSHLELAKRVIPAGASTMSKSYTRYVVGPSPLFVARAKGAYFTDMEGRRYLDFGMGLGACILGYSYPEVNRAIRDALIDGTLYTLSSYMEAKVAEQLLSYLPWGEQLRWAKNGTDVTTAAVRVARAYTNRDKVLHCYDEKTEVLTKGGFKSFKDVEVGESVATLNLSTNVWEYQQVQETYKYDYEGEMIHFSGRRADLCVTPNHRVLYEYRDSKRHLYRKRITEATHLLDFSSKPRLTCASDWGGESPLVFDLDNQQVKGWRTKGSCSLPIEPFVKFLGWWFSEGSVTVHSRRRGNRYSRYDVAISQSDKADGAIDDIIHVIQAMGFRPYRNGHHVVFSSKELAIYLRQFGHAKDKFLPDWLKSLSRPLLKMFISRFLWGDGTKGGNPDRENPTLRFKLYTSSRRLADDLQEICLKAGYAACLTPRVNPSSRFRGRVISKGEIFHLSVSPRTRFATEHPRTIPYKGAVWCVSVPNGMLMVRRNGKCVWSGNSGYHGWGDWSVATTPPALGIPGVVKGLSKPFTLDAAGIGEAMRLLAERDVAAVVVEVAQRAHIDDLPLRDLRRWCSEYGTVLVFDEVLSGFRYRMGSASEVVPDLGCYGKAIANGMPLSALVGKRALMQLLEPGGVFFSGTFGGEVLSLAACEETLKVLDRESIHDRLTERGRTLSFEFNTMIEEVSPPRTILCSGDGARTVVDWNLQQIERDYFQQECAKEGLLFIGAHNLSASHTWYDVRAAVAIYGRVLRGMSGLWGNEEEIRGRLEGPPTTPAYRTQ